MQALLQAIRRGCSPAVWSKAVELARTECVIALNDSDLRVATDGGLKSATVTLYIEDAEWTCDCDSTADACVHVAAAAIALNRANNEGRSLQAVKLPHIGYRLTTVADAVSFDRVLGGEPLTTSLSEASKNGVKLAATQADMTVEVLLGTRPRGALVREHWQKLWPALSECEDVTLDGEKVTLGPPAAIDAVFLNPLRVQRRQVRTWSNGLALEGSSLFLVKPLPADILKMDVQALIAGNWVSGPIPELIDVAPSLVWDIVPQGPGLSVMATLVYGTHARVDGDKLTLLSGSLPKRRPHEEQRLRAQVPFRLGERKYLTPDEAPAFLQQMGKRVVSGRWSVEQGVSLEGVSAGEVQSALRAGQSLIAMKDGSFVVVPETMRHLERLLSGRIEPTAKVEAARLLKELQIPAPPDLSEMAKLLDGEVAPAELPSDLTATLRDYQRQGVDWLVFMRRAGLGALLADDMGLGKTLQTIASLPAGQKHLIVAPTSVLSVWQKELQRFRPALSVNLYHGASRKMTSADVVLTSYGTVRQGIDGEWDSVILDEAQAIKNADSQTARACFDLKATHRLALTGTPIENSADELVSIFHFLNPGFRLDVGSSGALATISAARVRPFVLRRTKEMVARDLPSRTDNVLVCELSTEERSIYEAMRAATVPSVLAALESDVLSALEALLRLRQAASHPQLLPGHRDWDGQSAKVTALVSMIETLVREGHKALVFSQWTGFLDIVQKALSHVPFCRLDGATTNRGDVVRTFEDPNGPPVMLISLKAGGTGLTLTSADYVFLLDPWWNPAVEEQAAARAHRIGQTKPVFVYRLIAKDTVEERLLALQSEKRALFDAVLGDEALAKRLTRDDLRGLLQ